jgi:hypothetical protein
MYFSDVKKNNVNQGSKFEEIDKKKLLEQSRKASQ